MKGFRNPCQNWEIVVQRILGRHRSSFNPRDKRLIKVVIICNI